ncbi:hypothetical protein ACJX0J_007648, partial [Zea mays]
TFKIKKNKGKKGTGRDLSAPKHIYGNIFLPKYNLLLQYIVARKIELSADLITTSLGIDGRFKIKLANDKYSRTKIIYLHICIVSVIIVVVIFLLVVYLVLINIFIIFITLIRNHMHQIFEPFQKVNTIKVNYLKGKLQIS